MGTNYYLITDACNHCNRGEEEVHLGKASGGWAFSFRGYRPNHIDNLPEGIEKVENFEEWKALVLAPGCVLKDEYGEVLDKEQFIESCRTRGERIGEKALYHAQYMENHEYRAHFDDRMIDGHSFSFQEFC